MLVIIAAIPLGLILSQGLLAPFILIATDDPDLSIYVLSTAVTAGWIGLIGLLRTSYTLGSRKSPGQGFVALTFVIGTIGLALAVYAFGLGSFIIGFATVIWALSMYMVYLWSKSKGCKQVVEQHRQIPIWLLISKEKMGKKGGQGEARKKAVRLLLV